MHSFRRSVVLALALAGGTTPKGAPIHNVSVFEKQ